MHAIPVSFIFGGLLPTFYGLFIQTLWGVPFNETSGRQRRRDEMHSTVTNMRASRARVAKTCGTIFLIATSCSVVQPRSFAQTAGQSQNSAVDSSARSAPNAASANQDLVRELEKMRARILELETQLKPSGTAAITRTAESSLQSGTTQDGPASPAVQSYLLSANPRNPFPQSNLPRRSHSHSRTGLG